MVKERCLKKTFQESLEDIKERMKEKRAKRMAKIVTIKAFAAKPMKTNSSSVSLKSFEENNRELALSLEAEKLKTREAQDLILHLKREKQSLMFEIFMLRRKLTLQNGRESTDNKLSSLKGIIAKVTYNLLETAKLLGPAQALCSSNTTNESAAEIRTTSADCGTVSPQGLRSYSPDSEAKGLLKVTKKHGQDENLNRIGEVLENSGKVTSQAKGRGSCSYPTACTSEVGNLNTNDKTVSACNLYRNVSTRRRGSNLNVCIEESTFPEDVCLNTDSRTENLAPAEECPYTNSEGMETVSTIPSPSKEEFLPDTEMSTIASSTPEPRRKEKPPKTKEEPRRGRERVKKGKTDKGANVPLKKPWENTKSRARSKSRERATNKQTATNEKMNTSLNSGDAYDFVFEESVHVTPFRQNKQEDEGVDESSSDKSSDEEHTDDSLYVPYKESSKTRNRSDSSSAVPLRPRSKRRTVVQQQKKEIKKETLEEQANMKKNAKSVIKVKSGDRVETPKNVVTAAIENSETVLPASVDAEGATGGPNATCAKPDLLTATPIKSNTDESPPPCFSLSDVTNLSGCSKVKKHSCPILNSDEKRTGSPTRKRRCTVTVNYAEPKLSRKLRRGDPYTDTEFLNSPIYKHKDVRKSIKKNSLSRYNEAFVGCNS
uniref:Shugoshin 1 n=1 Tax=Leptobrachium leishanense TaxID=445787 RepID=A0A8C5PPH4_9ANUR